MKTLGAKVKTQIAQMDTTAEFWQIRPTMILLLPFSDFRRHLSPLIFLRNVEVALRIPFSVLVALAAWSVQGMSPSQAENDARTLMVDGQFAQVIEEFRTEVKQAQSTGDHLRMAKAHSVLGAAYTILNRDHEAETAFVTSIKEFEATGSVPSSALIDLSFLYSKLGRFHLAHDLTMRALESALGQTPQQAQEVAAALVSLARIEGHLGDPSSGEGHCRQALALLEEHGLHDSASWVAAASSLGMLLGQMGRFANGVQHLEQAEVVGESVLREPFARLTLAGVEANSARLNSFLQRIDLADKNFASALAIYESVLGESHYLTCQTTLAYADFCRRHKRKAEVELLKRRAQKCLTQDNPAKTRDVIDLREFSAPPLRGPGRR